MFTLVVIRHGQSEWNLKKLFTGWTDVPMTEKGIAEAHRAGQLLKQHGFAFDLAYTSYISRAIDTLSIVLEELGQSDLDVIKDWRWNERHYGALQGKSKDQILEEVGPEQFQIWRRGFDTPPPALTKEDPRYPGHDPLYKDLSEDQLPLTESLKDVITRFMPLWNEDIAPKIKAGKKIIISAHGNTIRALAKHLENISEENITSLEIPTGVPLIYTLDEDLNLIERSFLDA